MASVLDRLSEQEHQKISRLFSAKARALPHHQRQVVAERGNPTHTLTRHGYQTGWESQLMRLMTGRTPDQPEDEDGVRDAVQKYRAKEALPRRSQGKINYANADSVGAFLSPEVEAFAINRARGKARPLMAHSWAQTTSRAGTVWTPYDYIDMVVCGPHALSGVSFSRLRNAPALTQAESVQAIEDFINQKRLSRSDDPQSWDDKRIILNAMENADVSGQYSRSAYRKDYALRFPNMSDLLAFLGVRALWMRNVNVAFRRFGPNDWRVHTAYCVDCTEVPSPTRGGPSVKTGRWTGRLRSVKDGPETMLPPEWRS